MIGKFVTVTTFPTPIEAQLARTKLASEGIDTFLADENLVRVDWFLTSAARPVSVQVQEGDFARASEVLSRVTPTEEFPEGLLDERSFCPKCGSDTVTFAERNRTMFVLSMLLPLPLPAFRRKWVCSSCEYRWK